MDRGAGSRLPRAQVTLAHISAHALERTGLNYPLSSVSVCAVKSSVPGSVLWVETCRPSELTLFSAAERRPGGAGEEYGACHSIYLGTFHAAAYDGDSLGLAGAGSGRCQGRYKREYQRFHTAKKCLRASETLTQRVACVALLSARRDPPPTGSDGRV